MRKRTAKLTLRMETIANLSRLGGIRAGTGDSMETCTSDWFSCNGFTCATWEYDTCTSKNCG